MPFARSSGSDRGFDRAAISSLALAVGNLLAWDRSNHILIKATSSTSMEDIEGVCVEATTSSDTSVLYQKIVDKDKYIVNVTNNSNENHNGQRMVLTDEATVNNTGSDSTSDAAVVVQRGTVGAAADKKIVVQFVTRQDRA